MREEGIAHKQEGGGHALPRVASRVLPASLGHVVPAAVHALPCEAMRCQHVTSPYTCCHFNNGAHYLPFLPAAVAGHPYFLPSLPPCCREACNEYDAAVVSHFLAVQEANRRAAALEGGLIADGLGALVGDGLGLLGEEEGGCCCCCWCHVRSRRCRGPRHPTRPPPPPPCRQENQAEDQAAAVPGGRTVG